MPYIQKNERRKKLRNGSSAQIAGELNYQIFWFIKHYNVGEHIQPILHSFTKKSTVKMFVDQFLGKKPNYQRWNDMTGCLIRCYKEIERRLGYKEQVLLDIMESYDDEINKYEDIKIKENGDVE